MYNVTITGQQSHIRGNSWEKIDEQIVNQIIEKHLADGYERPKFDGNCYELNGDHFIKIEKA